MGNGFPGLAIVSMVALFVALALAILIGLRPWAATSVAPQLGLAPGIGVAVGDAAPAPPGRAFAVAPARPAGSDGTALVAAVAAGGNGSRPVAGLAAAQALTRPAPAEPAPGAPQPASPPVPPPSPVAEPEQPPPSPEPVATPVAVPAPQPVAAVPVRVPYVPGFQPGPTSAGAEPPPIAPPEPLEVREGDEDSFSFSFAVEPTSFLVPGEENSVLRFADPAGEAPTFALQLWDDGAGQRGLWSSGAAMGGERFLAPLAEGAWHRLTVDFVASAEEDGLYLLTLDGEAIDMRAWVSLLPAGGVAEVEAGL